jgi:hypothetical protein
MVSGLEGLHTSASSKSTAAGHPPLVAQHLAEAGALLVVDLRKKDGRDAGHLPLLAREHPPDAKQRHRPLAVDGERRRAEAGVGNGAEDGERRCRLVPQPFHGFHARHHLLPAGIREKRYVEAPGAVAIRAAQVDHHRARVGELLAPLQVAVGHDHHLVGHPGGVPAAGHHHHHAAAHGTPVPSPSGQISSSTAS